MPLPNCFKALFARKIAAEPFFAAHNVCLLFCKQFSDYQIYVLP